MRYCAIKPTDIANGEGVRVSLFVSGCDRHCHGCFNPETWDFNYGEIFSEDVMAQLIDMVAPRHIAGLSILGGEPLNPQNASTVAALCRAVRTVYPDKTIWIYTGYDYEDIADNGALKYIDVLVDGAFVESEKDISLQFRGSKNQRLIDMRATRDKGKIVLYQSPYIRR